MGHDTKDPVRDDSTCSRQHTMTSYALKKVESLHCRHYFHNDSYQYPHCIRQTEGTNFGVFCRSLTLRSCFQLILPQYIETILIFNIEFFVKSDNAKLNIFRYLAYEGNIKFFQVLKVNHKSCKTLRKRFQSYLEDIKHSTKNGLSKV
ncbi:hypothetical protein GQX74_010306 [Glossina fuscipes]|nr:hypothetical protein GQX74_010306 [Glossina fuscipes]